MIKQIILILSITIFSTCSAFAAEEPDSQIHQELRGLLKQAEDAINSGNYDAMLPILSENLRITPVNQEFLSSRKDVSEYFNKWFGEGGYLKKLHITFNADAKTELSNDKTWGIVVGKGQEDYILSDTRKYELLTRWTAVVVKESDGHWRIRSMHVGTDFLDNPILEEAANSGKYIGIAGLVVGLILGLLFARFFRRRNQ